MNTYGTAWGWRLMQRNTVLHEAPFQYASPVLAVRAAKRHATSIQTPIGRNRVRVDIESEAVFGYDQFEFEQIQWRYDGGDYNMSSDLAPMWNDMLAVMETDREERLRLV
jgi:hypothetical protein